MRDTELEVPLPCFLHATVFIVYQTIWYTQHNVVKTITSIYIFFVSQTIKQIFYSIVHIHALCVCHCFNGCMYIQFVDIVLEAILFLNLQSQFRLYVLVHGCYNLHVYISLFLLIHVWLCTSMFPRSR